MKAYQFMTGNITYQYLKIIKDMLGENLIIPKSNIQQIKLKIWPKNIEAEITVYPLQGFLEEFLMINTLKMKESSFVRRLLPKFTNTLNFQMNKYLQLDIGQLALQAEASLIFWMELI